MKGNIKIMVCCHKQAEVCTDEIYLPVQVGHAISNSELDMQKDDQVGDKECDNISCLNPIYCEMTAMYWAWKNIRKLYPDLNYVGLCHYRRYFLVKNCNIKNFIAYLSLKRRAIVKIFLNKPSYTLLHDPSYQVFDVKNKELVRSNVLLPDIVCNYDVITTKPCNFINRTVEDFFKVIGRDYIDLMTEIVVKDFPKYEKYYHKVIHGNKLHAANMIILKVELLDEYCHFVFSVLKKHICLTKDRGLCYNPEAEGNYRRVSGYLAEILTCTWIFYCKDKFKLGTIGKCFVENT